MSFPKASPWVNVTPSNPLKKAEEDYVKKMIQPTLLEPKKVRLTRLDRERHPGQLVSSAQISLGANTPKLNLGDQSLGFKPPKATN